MYCLETTATRCYPVECKRLLFAFTDNLPVAFTHPKQAQAAPVSVPQTPESTEQQFPQVSPPLQSTAPSSETALSPVTALPASAVPARDVSPPYIGTQSLVFLLLVPL